ncbi:MAG: methyltransferase domain-containing protein [Acidobacteria bacterium]|nr:methyltransferase domain-containing protein [Acidobacteriota bacterium]MBI3423820.1 methyltransferase domain-containing protein [Acidobacteriota bacterium]
MNRLKLFWLNLRFLFSRELAASLDEQEHKLDARVDAVEQRADTRADAYERALDTRLEERAVALEERLNAREHALDERWDTREQTVDERLDSREQAVDERLDARDQTVDERLELRFSAQAEEATTRANNYEAALDVRVDERFAKLEAHTDERFSVIEQRNDAQLIALAQRLDERFDGHMRLTDNRFDDRFARAERQIDERFVALEKLTDTRMERHEKRTDANLKLNRADILDRTDVMLQIFEQRLDQQRRELKALREQLAKQQAGGEVKAQTNGNHPAATPAETEPPAPVQSFLKLAQSSGLIGATKLPTTDATLYQKILDWKKVAPDKLTEFTADEREVVDYILSFISDAGERAYTQQHLRRFLSTLQRIPPPQRSTDRLLELGSLLHLVPALKKFSGYQQVFGADYWEGAEKLTVEIIKQVNGSESHKVELRNFNVESDPFPYPDKHFRVVLCCELLEHLQRDPLHMLWECNRVLQDDGFLLLTTPNIASARSLEGVLIGCAPYLLSQYNLTSPADQHNREYAPYEVGIALAAAGFTAIELETEDVWLRSNPAILKLLEEVNLPTDMRGDNIFALAQKSGPPVERYPKEFYIE